MMPQPRTPAPRPQYVLLDAVGQLSERASAIDGDMLHREPTRADVNHLLELICDMHFLVTDYVFREIREEETNHG